MVFSDAQPVQFWPVECDTYNQHVHDGVFHRCFCQPWNCDDPITIQFTDLAEGSPPVGDDFALSIRDESGDELYSMPFDKSVLLQLAALADADNSGSGTDWTIDADPSVLTSATSKILRLAIQGTQANVDYEFHYDISKINSLAFTDGTINIKMYNSSMAVIDEFTIDVTGALPDDFTGTITFLGSDEIPAYIGVNTVVLASGNFTTTVNELTLLTEPVEYFTYDISFVPSELSPELCERLVSFMVINTTTDTEVYKSDCQDIAQSHKNSFLIKYYNHVNYAGLVYDNGPEFSLRIKAIFFHQRFPGEDEVMELSQSLLTLNSTLRKQRLLDTDFMPYYMHEKIQLILNHQFVTIYNKQWTRQEAYEVQDGNRMYPEKKAKCWISEKNFIQRNVL